MRRIRQVFIVAPLSLAALATCKSRSHDQPPAPSAKTTESTSDFVDARDRLVRESQAKLDELDVKLANLRRDADARSATLTSESKVQFDDAIAKASCVNDRRRRAKRRATARWRASCHLCRDARSRREVLVAVVW